jgi:hypothetical protein
VPTIFTPGSTLASVSYTMPSTASLRATSASAARTLSAIANLFSTEAQIPSFSSALLAYFPTGTELTSAVAMRPSPISFARSKPGLIATVSTFDSFGAISTSRLPSRLTRVSSMMTFLCAA